MRKSCIEIYLKLRILFQIDLNLSTRKVLHLLNYLCYFAVLVCTSCIFSHLFLGNRISSLVTGIYIIVIAKLEHDSIAKLLTKNAKPKII